MSEDKKKAYVCATFTTAMPNAKSCYVKPAGLESKGKYYVKQLDITASGDTLMHAGIPLVMPPGGEYACLAFDLERVSE